MSRLEYQSKCKQTRTWGVDIHPAQIKSIEAVSKLMKLIMRGKGTKTWVWSWGEQNTQWEYSLEPSYRLTMGAHADTFELLLRSSICLRNDAFSISSCDIRVSLRESKASKRANRSIRVVSSPSERLQRALISVDMESFSLLVSIVLFGDL